MKKINEKRFEVAPIRDYICSQCGANMMFEDENRDILICPKCGHSIDLDRYGFEGDEEYVALYPTKEEILGEEYEDDNEDDIKEVYDEECGELDDYVP